jgi:methionine synthase I (cobalamin-dependent)
MFDTAFQANAFQNDAFQIVITPVETKRGGDDASWTPEERKRYKSLQKKLRIAEEKRMAAQKADQDARKNFIREQVSPTPKVSKSKQDNVESVSVEKQKEIVNYNALIANLERQRQDLFNAVLIRQAKEQLELEIAVLEAKRLAELDDEESIIALFL